MIPRGLGLYVYLNSLKRDASDYASSMKTASTFNLENIRKDHNNFSPLINAISILKKIAITEQNKEHQAILSYLTKLDKHLNNKENPLPETVENILKRQRDHLQKFSESGYQPDEFHFVEAINLIKQNINTYERRLSEITKKSSITIPEERFEYRIQQDVENFIRNQSEQNKFSTSKDVKRDRLLKKELMKIIQSNSFLSSAPAALQNELLAILFIDFNNWLETNSKGSYKTIPIGQFGRFLKQLVTEYMSKSKSALEQTHVQRLIEQNNDELKLLTTDLNKMWHGTYLSSQEAKELDTLLKETEQHNIQVKKKSDKWTSITTSNNITYSLKQARDLLTTYNERIDSQDSSNFAFTLHTATSHGNFYEFLLTVLTSAINVRANVGADLIAPIGTFTFNIAEQEQQKFLTNLSSEIGDTLSTSFEEQDKLSIKNLDNLITNQRTASSHIQEKLNKTRQALDACSDLNEDFFIAHESLKLYGTAEKSNTEFHGRSMKALSVLTKLYASPSIGDALIGREKLIIYLLNLSPSTLAGNLNQQPLETYFSLFAGLLMFDDLEEMVQSYVSQIEDNIASTTINTIHVYNINGIYFPVSVILNNLVEQCEECMQDSSLLDLNNNKTATAHLIYPKRINKPKTSELEDWEALADKVINKTSIQIRFFKGFNDYITKLFTNFNQ